MKIMEVKYGFTKNLGNFQSARVDVAVQLGDEVGDDPDTALELAAAFVHEALEVPLSTREEQILTHYRSTTADERALAVQLERDGKAQAV